jgi:hypothetical protein
MVEKTKPRNTTLATPAFAFISVLFPLAHLIV